MKIKEIGREVAYTIEFLDEEIKYFFEILINEELEVYIVLAKGNNELLLTKRGKLYFKNGKVKKRLDNCIEKLIKKVSTEWAK